jgi:hypothetical protein
MSATELKATTTEFVAPNPAQSSPLMTRERLQQELARLGYPITMSYLNKICAPLVNEGPQPVKYWNRRPLYDLAQAIEWAEAKSRRAPSVRPREAGL